MTKTYTEKRFFQWYEDEVSVTLRERSGSYGGGSEVLVIEQTGYNQQSHSGDYKRDDIAANLTVCGGTYGGGPKP